MFRVIRKLIQALDLIHGSGYTYNDVKLDNIMVKHNDKQNSKPKFVLVDYGMAQKYVDEDGNHL